jgi:pre-mycofactocin synthase
MSTIWFESVAEAQRRAARRLPPSVYRAIQAGTERGVTSRDNTEAFDELGFLPHVGRVTGEPDLETTILGQRISMPVVISPTGVQAVHPDGELAVARAAASRGVAMGLSSFGSQPVEDVVACGAPTFFQLYWVGTRDDIARRVERARAAGAQALILTLDWTFSHSRDWGSPVIPETIDLKAIARFAPEAARRPGWTLDFVRSGRLPDLTVPNMVPRGDKPPTFFGAYGQWMQTPPPSWDDVAWLVESWSGPMMIKGVMRVDDALCAAAAGVNAISVSNHGGNNLDSTPASIRVLPAIVDAVGDRLEVVMDGGIRRGSDVVKAIALGARAVMIGRASLYGLAGSGQVGVENVLDILRNGIASTLAGLGRSSVSDVERTDVIMPAEFARFTA